MGRIMVIADRKGPCVATARGLALAEALGCSVEIVAFTYASLRRLGIPRDEQAGVKRGMLDRREQVLREQIDREAPAGTRVGLRVVWMKDIAPWVIQRTESREYDYVVKTAHHSASVSYTSTDWQLLRESAAPVLIVAGKRWHRQRPLLVALDLATRSKSKRALNRVVLGHANRLAEALGVSLSCISAMEIPHLLTDLDVLDPNDFTRRMKRDMQPHITELADAFSLPTTVFRCRRGATADVISREVAKLDAQLVVIGTVGRRGLRAKLLGNTAESVLQSLSTDVLAVRPPVEK
ncbi:universal stress protein [Chromatocurvus halotolerans]|uniref:Universal stress protein E n=1 Tax=Chromatocurvus halotolerans TaxID=1132028 RepID=A0A4R2LER3_9GAMM|nr:universal stress protein [Chromatocurvus halotolerans]TCO77765.1 universal stress protein E [Chromatocurvus halotolerans]